MITPKPFFKRGEKIKSRKTQMIYTCTAIEKLSYNNFRFTFLPEDGEAIRIEQGNLSNILSLYQIL